MAGYWETLSRPRHIDPTTYVPAPLPELDEAKPRSGSGINLRRAIRPKGFCRGCGAAYQRRYAAQRFCCAECRELAPALTHPRAESAKPSPISRPGAPTACAQCGEPFPQRRAGQRFCSIRCVGAANSARDRMERPGPLTCARCGREFTPSRNRPGQRYCSVPCACQDHKRAPRPEMLRICNHCGETFAARRRTQRFCSISCARRGRYAHRHASRPCERCGKPFVLIGTKPRRFCSRACAGTARKSPPANLIQRTCDGCGATFIPRHSIQRFCSRRCSCRHAQALSVRSRRDGHAGDR